MIQILVLLGIAYFAEGVVQLPRRFWASDICSGDISAASIAALAWLCSKPPR
jgi:hypothetical protein